MEKVLLLLIWKKLYENKYSILVIIYKYRKSIK